MTPETCRFCNAEIRQSFCDLGMSPPSNAFLLPEQLNVPESFYPLHAFVCGKCFLVQLGEYESPEQIFRNYAYFSSYSESWLRHAAAYVDMIVQRRKLSPASFVIEIASNDGYLLQHFNDREIPALGVEPAANVAGIAQQKGVRTVVRFFGADLARELTVDGRQADLLIANNVLAHVPRINDFVAGIAIALKRSGIATIEFPHLLRLIEENQFDTIYHEHFSYFSLHTAERIFSAHGLAIVDVEELSTHGGSLRIYAEHRNDGGNVLSARMQDVKRKEQEFGINEMETYTAFNARVRSAKRDLLAFLLDAKRHNQTVVGYGAAAKGNTLLNYCGIREDFLDYVVDRSPHKQGRFLPGTHIPVYGPERIVETRPDYVLILPWNLKHEIVTQMTEVREWGGKFVVAIPRVEILT